MDENKGRNFLFGLVVIFIVTKVWFSGVLNDYGYMQAGCDFVTGSNGTDEVVRGPAADMVDLLVDLVVIVGYVTGIVIGGIYDTFKYLVGLASDGARKAKARIEEADSEANAEVDAAQEDDTEKEDVPVEEMDPILVIAEAVQKSQKIAEDNRLAIQDLRNAVKGLIVARNEPGKEQSGE